MGQVRDSATYLAEHMHEAPVLLIPCIEGRDDKSPLGGVSFWASLFPAVWSFCLALRSRGLGSCWTTLHLLGDGEQQAAEVLGIPYDRVQPGRAVSDRLHQGHRLPAGQAAARRESHPLEHLVARGSGRQRPHLDDTVRDRTGGLAHPLDRRVEILGVEHRKAGDRQR